MAARRVLIAADTGGPTFLSRRNQLARLFLRPRALIPALAMFALLSLASLGSAAASAGDAPVWSLGERWTYEGVVWGPGPREDFTANVTVIALSAEDARVRAEITYGFGTVIQDTLVSLPSFRVVAFNASFPSGIRHRSEYGPPLELLSFPLTAGKTWSSASNFTYSYRTLPLTQVSTAAGIFDAFPVEQSAMGIPFITLELIVPDLGSAVMYYSAAVGQIVRYEAFDLRSRLVAEFSITEFSVPSGAARLAVDPEVGPGAVIVATLIVGAAGASTAQILRTVNTARASGGHRLA